MSKEGSDDRIVEIKLILDKLLDENEPDKPDDHQVLTLLDELSNLNIDKPALSKTKIGFTMNKLKSCKSLSEEVSGKCRELVKAWKEAVSAKKEEEKPQESHSKEENERIAPKEISVDTEYSGKYTKDEKRDRCRDFLFKAFLEGMSDDQRNMLELQQVCQLVADIEDALYEHHVLKMKNMREYNNQLRALKSNLADKKNPEFNARIYLGALLPSTLAQMQSTEMASDAKKRERQKAKKDALEACQSDWDLRNVKRAKGMFPCGKCKSEQTTYFQMQTRSSDEPMTTYVNCLNCGNRWKF